ncbi:1632_t:CDS:2, partial [Funneliformis geosporum]
ALSEEFNKIKFSDSKDDISESETYGFIIAEFYKRPGIYIGKITPHPDEVTVDVTIRLMRSYLVFTLSASDAIKDHIRIEITEDFARVAQMVLERSREELIDFEELITKFYMNHIHKERIV